MRMICAAFFVYVAAHVPGAAAATSLLPAPPAIAAKSYILMDANTKKVLVEFNGDEPLPPASLTKIMTSYVAAAEVEAGRINLTDEVPISVKAWKTPGSRMFVREGTRVPLLDLLKGVVIQSGNDASVAIAEYIAGSESAFADMMNQHSAELGLVGSQFENSTGLPDENHYSTARDMATLALELIHRYPDHYQLYRGTLVYLQQYRAAEPQPPAVARPYRRWRENGTHQCGRVLPGRVGTARRDAPAVGGHGH